MNSGINRKAVRFGAMALAAALLLGACNLKGAGIHVLPEETDLTEPLIVTEPSAEPVFEETETATETEASTSTTEAVPSEAPVIAEPVTETSATMPILSTTREELTTAEAVTETTAQTTTTTEITTDTTTTETTTESTTAEPTTAETPAAEPETEETTTELVTTVTAETEPSTSQGSAVNPGSNSGYSSLGLPEPDSHRRFRSGAVWPESYSDSFSTIEITADVRKDILSFGTALVGLPYVYPRTSTWWAPDSIYSYSYDVLYRSRKQGGSEGDFDYVYGPDCSAFVKAAVDFATGSKMHNYVPTMRAAMLSRPEYEKPVDDMSAWIPGDILILGEGKGSYRHVAIYFGDGYLLHSVGYRVQISHISDWSFRPRGDLFVKHVFAPPGVLSERSNTPPSGALTLPEDFAVPVQVPAHIRDKFGIVTSPAATPKPAEPTAAVTETPVTTAGTTVPVTTEATTQAPTTEATTQAPTTEAPSTAEPVTTPETSAETEAVTTSETASATEAVTTGSSSSTAETAAASKTSSTTASAATPDPASDTEPAEASAANSSAAPDESVTPVE